LGKTDIEKPQHENIVSSDLCCKLNAILNNYYSRFIMNDI